MQKYLGAMRQGLDALQIDAPLLIMQSAGGLTPEEENWSAPGLYARIGPRRRGVGRQLHRPAA